MFYICSLQTTNILYVHILKKESVFHYHSAKAFIDNPRQSGGFILQIKATLRSLHKDLFIIKQCVNFANWLMCRNRMDNL